MWVQSLAISALAVSALAGTFHVACTTPALLEGLLS